MTVMAVILYDIQGRKEQERESSMFVCEGEKPGGGGTKRMAASGIRVPKEEGSVVFLSAGG